MESQSGIKRATDEKQDESIEELGKGKRSIVRAIGDLDDGIFGDLFRGPKAIKRPLEEVPKEESEEEPE